MKSSRLLVAPISAALLALTLVGCGQTGYAPMGLAAGETRDWSQLGAFATHKKRPRKKPKAADSGALSGLLATSRTEDQAPEGFALTSATAKFRAAIESQAESQRVALARAILNDSQIMGAFRTWDSQSQTQQVAVIKAIAQVEGKTFSFTPPPIVTKSGVPSDGTLGFFEPASSGLGSVTLYPAAIAKGDKWAALDTIVHEMRHAYQDQLEHAAAAHKFSTSSTNEVLADAYYDSQTVIQKVGGEDNLTYGDYAHLNMEFDAFQTGNRVATIVSQGGANTSGLGYIDAQYKANGDALVDLGSLERKVGANGLIDALNQLEEQAVHVAKSDAFAAY